MRLQHFTIRPSVELHDKVQAMGEELDLTDAELCRQLLVYALEAYDKGECKIVKSPGMRSRETSLLISKKKKGRKQIIGITMRPAPGTLPTKEFSK